jgi:hypothetical protein
MPAPAVDFKLIPNSPHKCHVCALCGHPHALVMISRQAEGCSETVVDDQGVLADVAVVHTHHFPAGFTRLPPRIREVAIAAIWSEIDRRQGRMPPVVRLQAVRTKLGASDEERGASIPDSILTPNSSRPSERSVLSVLRSWLLATRAKRAKLTSGVITFVTFFKKGETTEKKMQLN